MIDLLGLHTHTTASGYAYNSLYKMAHSASVRGLSLSGCSDHAPAMPGSCYSFHFIDFKVLPRTLYGVRLMMGVELNIMDYDGTVNLGQSALEPLGCAIASLCQPCIHSGTALQNTSAYLGTLKDPLIHIIGHLDDSCFSIDYDALVVAAGEYRKLPEVNNSSLNPLNFRVGARDNHVRMLEPYRHYGASIIINSDTHCKTNVSNHGFAHALPEEVDFPQELIVNASPDHLCGSLPKAATILAQQEDGRCGYLYRSGTMQEETIQEKNVSRGNES